MGKIARAVCAQRLGLRRLDAALAFARTLL